jgi:hypothetical protein
MADVLVHTASWACQRIGAAALQTPLDTLPFEHLETIAMSARACHGLSEPWSGPVALPVDVVRGQAHSRNARAQPCRHNSCTCRDISHCQYVVVPDLLRHQRLQPAPFLHTERFCCAGSACALERLQDFRGRRMRPSTQQHQLRDTYEGCACKFRPQRLRGVPGIRAPSCARNQLPCQPEHASQHVSAEQEHANRVCVRKIAWLL